MEEQESAKTTKRRRDGCNIATQRGSKPHDTERLHTRVIARLIDRRIDRSADAIAGKDVFSTDERDADPQPEPHAMGCGWILATSDAGYKIRLGYL